MRLQNYIFLFTTFLLLTAISSGSIAGSAVTSSVGSTGLGVEWISSLNENLNTRLLITSIGLDSDLAEDDIDYKARWNSTNFGAVVDWHPGGSRFRISGGLVSTNFAIELRSEEDQQNFQIGDRLYNGDIELEGDLDFNNVVPYFSIGWASNLSGKGLYLSSELGALLVGNPTVKVKAKGTATANDVNEGSTFDVTSNPEFQTDLELERQNLIDELNNFQVFPILNVGIGYRY